MSKQFTIKSLRDFITEDYTATIGLKKNVWTDIKPDKHPSDLADEFYELINRAYAPIGGHIKVTKPSDVFKDKSWNAWKVIDIDKDPEADVLIFGKKTKFGTKSSGVGHDGSKLAKKAYLNYKGNSFHKPGNYCEVSKKFAEIMLKKYKVPTVDIEDDVKKILGKKREITWYGAHPTDNSMPGNGWYSRKIAGNDHIKIMIGRPKV